MYQEEYLNIDMHHKNGNKLDNRIENLELCHSQAQPPGQRIVDLIVWAKNILNQYEQEYENKLKVVHDKQI